MSCHSRRVRRPWVRSSPPSLLTVMVSEMALTPARGACFDVRLPCFHCWRGDALCSIASSPLAFAAAAMRSRFSWRGSMPWSIIVCSRRASSRAARECPCSNVADGHADSLPVQLGFKDERLGASGHANGQPRRVGVPEEGLPGALGQGQAADSVGRQAFAVHVSAPGLATWAIPCSHHVAILQ
jgi:hypothetical protein